MPTEFKPTKETVIALIGTAEGFSADVVKNLIDERYKAATIALAKHREKHGIVVEGKTR